MGYTMGSLFDGSGGFPLAASMCGITPLWAAEVEPYLIAVTRSRFPAMKHLGDITKVNGAEIEPVDIITFGSPCQSLSVAGKREGIRHETLGDDETTRSGLFMEAIRIIKEMRGATDGRYPTFAIWENVQGAFNSSKGEDFRIVLEEFIKIVHPTTEMPAPDKKGWAYADIIMADGFSLAYRLVDAQYWGKSIRDRDSGAVRHLGTPQRRRRIYLVADFRGERAGEILFKLEGLQGYYTQGRTPWQGVAADAEGRIGTDDSERSCVGFPLGFRPENVRCYDETATTLVNGTRAGFCNGVIVRTYDARGNGDGVTVNTITGDHNNRVTDYTSLVCEVEPPHYIVRRLTPTECARLQGFPDKWGHPDKKDYLTDSEYRMWHKVRNTFEEINGKKVGNYNKEQMLKWYNKLHSDSAEYKMWGNGIALPNALYVMQGIADALKEKENAEDTIHLLR